MSPDAVSPGTVHGEHRWDFVFAAMYDRMMRRGEERSMGRRRGELVAQASGRTLEIGAGTGANLPYYPDAVEELILAEPFEPMRRRLERKLGESGRVGKDARRLGRSDPAGGGVARHGRLHAGAVHRRLP